MNLSSDDTKEWQEKYDTVMNELLEKYPVDADTGLPKKIIPFNKIIFMDNEEVEDANFVELHGYYLYNIETMKVYKIRNAQLVYYDDMS